MSKPFIMPKLQRISIEWLKFTLSCIVWLTLGGDGRQRSVYRKAIQLRKLLANRLMIKIPRGIKRTPMMMWTQRTSEVPGIFEIVV